MNLTSTQDKVKPHNLSWGVILRLMWPDSAGYALKSIVSLLNTSGREGHWIFYFAVLRVWRCGDHLPVDMKAKQEEHCATPSACFAVCCRGAGGFWLTCCPDDLQFIRFLMWLIVWTGGEAVNLWKKDCLVKQAALQENSALWERAAQLAAINNALIKLKQTLKCVQCQCPLFCSYLSWHKCTAECSSYSEMCKGQ